jgi:hypothetical protein
MLVVAFFLALDRFHSFKSSVISLTWNWLIQIFGELHSTQKWWHSQQDHRYSIPVGTDGIMMASAKRELTTINQGPFCWKTDGNSASV